MTCCDRCTLPTLTALAFVCIVFADGIRLAEQHQPLDLQQLLKRLRGLDSSLRHVLSAVLRTLVLVGGIRRGRRPALSYLRGDDCA